MQGRVRAEGEDKMIEWFDDLKLGMLFKGGEVAVTREDIKRFATEFDPRSAPKDRWIDLGGRANILPHLF